VAAADRIYRNSQPQRGRLADNVVMLEEAIEKLRRFIGDADDFVRCLAIEFKIQLGFRLSIIPIGKLFEFAPPQCPFRQRGAFDGDADAGRLTSDSAFPRDCLGGSDRATRDEASPALVLACQDEHRVAFGDMLAAIHRLLRRKHECLRPQIPNLGFNCERHYFPRSD
jgi:hypothetical protein